MLHDTPESRGSHTPERRGSHTPVLHQRVPSLLNSSETTLLGGVWDEEDKGGEGGEGGGGGEDDKGGIDAWGLTREAWVRSLQARMTSGVLNHHDSITGTCQESVVEELLRDSSEAVSGSAGVAAALMQRLLCRLCLQRAWKLDPQQQTHGALPASLPCCAAAQRSDSPGEAAGERAGDAGAWLQGLGPLQLLSSEAELLHFRGGGFGLGRKNDRSRRSRKGEAGAGGPRLLNVLNVSGGAPSVLVVANSLSWDVEQVVTVPVVGLAEGAAELVYGAQGVCLLDGLTGDRVQVQIDLEEDVGLPSRASRHGAEEGGLKPRRAHKRVKGVLENEAPVHLLRFSVEVAALGLRSLTLGPCSLGESTAAEEYGTGNSSSLGGCGGSGAGRGEGQWEGQGEGEADSVQITVELLVQKSSGIDGYSSGAYVLRSTLTNAFVQEAWLVMAAAAGLMLSSVLTLIACLVVRGRSSKRRGPTRVAPAPRDRPAEQQRTFSSRACSLGCAVGTQVSKVGVRNVTLGVLNVLLPLVVGAALGWALARLLPGAFSRHVGRSFFHRYLALLAGAWAGVCLGLLSQSRFCILLPRGACLRCWCTWCALLLVCVSMPVGLVAAQLLEPSTQFQSLGAPLLVSWQADCPWASPTEGAAAHQSPLQAPRRRAKGWTEAGKAGGALVSPLASDRSGSVAVHLSQSLHRPGLVEIRVQVGAPPCHTPHSCLRCLAVKPNS